MTEVEIIHVRGNKNIYLYSMNRSIRLGWMDGWISRVSFKEEEEEEERQNRLINAYKDTFRTKRCSNEKKESQSWRIKKRICIVRSNEA